MTPTSLLPIPGTPQAPDPLGGFRGLQPTPAAVTPSAPNTSRFDLPDPESTAEFGATPTPGFPDSRPETRQSSEPNDGETIEIVPFGDTDRLRTELADPGTEIVYLMPDAAQTPFLIDSPIIIGSDVIVHGNYAHLVGNAVFSSPMLIVSTGVSVQLHHVTIRNATNDGTGPYGHYGGAITNRGSLHILDSEIAESSAPAGGGGINNIGGQLLLERVTIRANQAGGGAGIQNDVSGSVTAVCSRFISNGGDYGGGILNGQLDNANGSVTVSYSVFDGNYSQQGAKVDIHNLMYDYVTLQAYHNWWGNDNNTPSVSSGVSVNPKLSGDPTLPPYTIQPRCQPKLPRIVSEEAVPLHVYAEEFGLPMPFDRLPYNIVQPGQSDNPLGWHAGVSRIAVQGFGPTSFALGDNDQSLYNLTFKLHSGLDYGGGRWDDRVVVSICDGVVIPGNPVTGAFPDSGGSASPGRGISIRCFIDSLASPFHADTDSDGDPNLSNIVITYNHLIWQPDNPDTPDKDERLWYSAAPHHISCLYVPSSIPCTERLTLPQIGDIIHTGDILGQTGAISDDMTFDHLHLSVHFARGFERQFQIFSDNSFYANPLLFYESEVADLHVFQDYFPLRLTSGLVENTRGITQDELDAFSGGGFNSAPHGDVSENDFLAVQQYPPLGPDNVEWPRGKFPLEPNTNPTAGIGTHISLSAYLELSFSAVPYQSPNCDLGTMVCALGDLTDETPYLDIAHPSAP